MIKINAIPLDYEPRKKIIPKLPEYIGPNGRREPEMSEFDSAFLCGALKQFRPKKILEVGVAGGATTAIILQVLEDIGEPYKMHSVDINTNLYFDKTTSTGFMATFAKENNLFAPSRSTVYGKYEYSLENNLYTPPQSTLCGKHEFHLGEYLPQIIDEIGGDIDFVILDTVHWMPGELLDFPVMSPYLKDGAVVILHDLTFTYYRKVFACATPALFCAVISKEKFLNYEQPKNTYPNIGAFRVDEQTRRHIGNIFLALMLRWDYVPSENEVNIYHDFYNKRYSTNFVEIFDSAVKYNRDYKARNK